MKGVTLILLLFASIVSMGQDSKVFCKKKNLFVPTGYIKDRNLNDIFNKCKNLQVVSENNIFLFTGFEKYGYTLLIDTITQKPRILNYFYGYFDLVNNTNVPLTILNLGYSVDIMHIIPLQKNRTQLLPGESIKVKYILVNGLSKISDQGIKKLIYNEENDEKNINLLINQLIVKQIMNKTNSFYSMSNVLNIGAQYQNGEFIDKNRFLVVFRIPVKYFQNIEYGNPY